MFQVTLRTFNKLTFINIIEKEQSTFKEQRSGTLQTSHIYFSEHTHFLNIAIFILNELYYFKKRKAQYCIVCITTNLMAIKWVKTIKMAILPIFTIF